MIHDNIILCIQAALRMMVDPRLFALAPRHITMSTVGIIPNIKHLAHDFPKVSLALSLHAPNQALRRSIVPSAAAYKLEALMDAIRHYQEITGQKVFIEYVMLEGVNDSVEQALELGQLLKGHRVTVNLIPWNPVLSPGMSFGAPPPNRVRTATRLRCQYAVSTSLQSLVCMPV
jgi:adenine C2-methylase RlmN of 23S rRNA A2503 and tRNA A37